jgi:Tfp pilus assembly protein PilW
MSLQRNSERGFSMVEVTIGVALAVMVSLAAVALVSVSRTGHERSVSAARTTGSMRDVSIRMREDIAQASNAGHFLVTTNPDGNDVIRMQRPTVTTNGTSSWGAADPSKPLEERMQDGFWARYQVETREGQRVLMRQMLDSLGQVTNEQVIARGIAAGSANPRGLRVETIGMTRRITIGFDSTSNQLTPWTRFDVVLKN